VWVNQVCLELCDSAVVQCYTAELHTVNSGWKYNECCGGVELPSGSNRRRISKWRTGKTQLSAHLTPIVRELRRTKIHDWIYESLKLPETDVRMIQIDRPRRRIYIKFHTSDRALSVLRQTAGRQEFHHDNGECSIVHNDLAGMGVRRIRLANLPPEVADRMIREALSQYGEVTEVQEDSWSKAHRYPVYNGIRIAVSKLNIYHHTW
jgi:hypothetical protein